MRILLLQDDIYLPSYAGGLKATRKLMEALAVDGHDGGVVCPALTRSREGPNTQRAFVQEMTARGIRVQSTEPNVFSYRHQGVRVDALDFPAPAEGRELVARRIRELRPDWVLVTEDKHRFMLECALGKAPGRVVLLIQTVVQLPFGPLAVRADCKQSELFTSASAIIVISDYLRRYIREHRGLECRVMQPPVYGDGPFAKPAGFGRGFITLINPCDLKGLPIFTSLAREFPEHPFAAVPTWGADEAVLDTLRQLPNVRILEPVDDIDEIFAQTSVLLVPSLWPESFGYVVVEAMLRGVPVLAGNVGGLPEAKLGVPFTLPVTPATRVDGRYVFPPQDVAPWVRALREMTRDAAEYERCSAASRSAALKFISSVNVASFERLFDGLRHSSGVPA